MIDLSKAVLVKQSYGINIASGTFGRPSGIWLECSNCPDSQKIVGSGSDEYDQFTDKEVAEVFIRAGWTGEDDKLTGAKCPMCSTAKPENKITYEIENSQEFAKYSVSQVYGKADRLKLGSYAFGRAVAIAHVHSKVSIVRAILNNHKVKPYQSVEDVMGDLQIILVDSWSQFRKIDPTKPPMTVEDLIYGAQNEQLPNVSAM